MMYVEFIGRVGAFDINECGAPACLCDPDIDIIEIRQVGPTLTHISPHAALLKVFVSDEDAAYLHLKYPKEQSYIFTKFVE